MTTPNLNTIRQILGLNIGKRFATYLPKSSDILRKKTALWLDDYFFHILHDLDVKQFIECGARDAFASTRFTQKPDCKAIAIEANPQTFASITKTAESNSVKILNYGIGKDDGEMDFHVPVSSPLAANASFRKREGEELIAHKIKVKCLDSILNDEEINDDNFALWIDVEGMGGDVVTGGKKMLSLQHCVAVKIELETYPHFEGQDLSHTVDQKFADLGFSAVLCDFEYTSQFNVLYVKNSHLDKIDSTLQLAFQAFPNLSVSWKETLFDPSQSFLSKRNVKGILLKVGGPKFEIFVHKIGAKLGSKQSEEYLKRITQS